MLDESRQALSALMAPPCTLLSSTAAQVTCIEQAGPGQLTCTNIFVLEEDGWKMLNHHAAPVMAAGPPQLPSD